MEMYKNKKIAILNATAIAYSGVSTCIEDIKKWEAKNSEDIKIDVFHYELKKQKVKSLKGFEYDYEEFTINETTDFVKKINNEYDIVVLMVEAKMRKAFPKEYFRNFYFEVWKKINIVKIRMQHEPNMTAVRLAPFGLNIANEADAIFTLADKSEYVENIRRALPSKRNRIYRYGLWLDFDLFDKWKEEPIVKQNKMTYIGRYTPVKNPDRIFAIAKEIKELGLNIEMHGFDSSVSTFQILNKEIVNDYVRGRNIGNGLVDVYPKYERIEGLKKLRESIFGFSFLSYKLEKDKGFYGDRLEYAQQEIIACRTVPILAKEWGENCRTKNGQRYIDIPNFAIWCERGNEKACLGEIEKVLNDKDLQQKYIDTSYKILKEGYHIDKVLPDILNKMCSITKDEDKFKNEYDLAYNITKDEETSKQYEAMMLDENNLSSTDFKKLYNNEVHVFGGKSGKASIKIN